MLRIVAQSRPDAAKSYYSQADYYAAGLDTPALWGGRGSQLLGLSGQVHHDDFAALCDNLDPRSGEQLTARTRTGRTVLYDFNVHVPKSLSVLIERTGDPRLMELVQEAGAAMMAEVETEMQTRVRKDGQDTNRTTGNMVWAMIPHRTSRPSKSDGKPDPHTHLHICAFNATYDGAENQWKAGQFRELVRDAPYWQAVFHSKLTESLAGLGYGIDRTAKGWEIAGVPQKVISKFSRRTGEIEALAADLGITDPDAKAKLGATSRQAKQEESITDLRAYWDSRLTPEERIALDKVASGENDDGIVHLRPTAESAVDYAVKHCFERASVVPEKRLVAAALQQGVGGVTSAEVRAEFNQRGIITRKWEGQLVATTKEVLAEEEKMLAWARSGRDACRPMVSDHTIQRTWLDRDQQSATQHVLQSRNRVVLVRGAAGAGKTKMTNEAVEAIEASGIPVLMLAPSAKASRGVLREVEKFETADTVARFLVDEKYREQARGGVIWVDEAGMVGAPTMAKLFDAAEALDARLVLMGDTRQHASVERGSSLRVLQTHAGLPVAEISEIKRQSGAYKKAVEALSSGRTEEGFGRLDSMGAIREISDEAPRLLALAESYKKATAKYDSVLVVAPTHAEADRVTNVLRLSLKAQGRLGEERTVSQLIPRHLTEAERGEARHYCEGDVLQFMRHAPGHPAGSRITVTAETKLPLEYAERFQVFRSATLPLAVGDKVRLTNNGWTRDKHRLNNDTTYTLAGFTDRGDLKLNNGWIVDREFSHVAHGLVSTSHAAQGTTVQHVIIAQSAQSLGASSAEQWYVSVSRGRKGVEVFTDDKTALCDAVSRSSPRLAAVELLDRRPEPTQSHGVSLKTIVADRLRRAVMERTQSIAGQDQAIEGRRYGSENGAA